MSDPIDPAAAGPPINAEPDLADQARARSDAQWIRDGCPPGLTTSPLRLAALANTVDALCAELDQLRVKLAEAAAEIAGWQRWATTHADDASNQAANCRDALARLAAVEAERDRQKEKYRLRLADWDAERAARLAAEAALTEIQQAAEISFRGPSHSNAWHLRQAASRLDKGYAAGGGNTTAAVARILRAVAALVVVPQPEPAEEAEAMSTGLPTKLLCQRGLEPHAWRQDDSRSDLLRCLYCGTRVAKSAQYKAWERHGWVITEIEHYGDSEQKAAIAGLRAAGAIPVGVPQEQAPTDE